ncbi:MATE family efflux transporter [Lacrimispora sp.]|uniref:MATE family efflux transporter n=1 Tax=Lacrimispora sp. TaxID=2719234 RepID=UPI003460D9D4
MTENNLDTDQIRGLVWRLAIPSMLAQFVSVFYSIVDRMYIGNISGTGEIALAGVGICGPIVTMVSSVAFLVGVGGSPLMSIRMGEKNHRAASQILANCFLLLTVLAAVITVFSLIIKDKLLMWFGASEATFSYANDYITICLLGTVFALLATGMNQFIICQGFAKVGMKSVILGAVCNIALDPVFMFGFGLGVRGAAIATVLSQMASCTYVLRFLFGDKPPIRITFGHYDWQIMRRVLLLGLSPFLIIAFDNVLIIALNMIIQRYGGESQGDKLLTCMTIVQSFMLMVTMPLGGITGGTQTILGYNFGAGRPDRIKRAAGHIGGLALVFTTIMFILAHTVPQYFVRIFIRNEAYVELTVWAIKIYTMGIIPLALQYTVVDGFVGMGAAKVAISLSMFRKAVFLVGAALIPIWFGVEQIFYIEPVSDFASVVVSLTVTFLVFDRMVVKKTAD